MKKRDDNIGARIKALRTAKGIKRAEAAEKAGISYDYFAKIENGHRSPNIETLARVLSALGTGVDEFFTAHGEFSPPEHGVPFPLDDWGLHHLGEARAAPIIGWAQAGEWTAIEAESGEDNVVWSDAISEGCYALLVEGDSMEPEFTQGDVIIVDPRAEPKPGDFVVARIEGEAEATFKQYRIRDGKLHLHALNPAHPDIELEGPFETVIAGVVIESKKLFPQPEQRAAKLAKIISRLSEMTDEELDIFENKIN